MEKLICSLCGYKSNQKHFKYKEVTKHFDNAKQIWCPRNCCKEKYNRIIPDGYVCNCWFEYGGWYTLEKKPNPKIINFETEKSILKAKLMVEKAKSMVLNKNK